MFQFCYLRIHFGTERCPVVAMDGNDGHESKLEKVGPTFSSLNARPANAIMVIAPIFV